LNSHVLKEFVDVLSFFQLPTSLPVDFKIDGIIKNLWHDKKIRNEKIQWITLKQIGVANRGQSIDLKQIKKILRGLQENG